MSNRSILILQHFNRKVLLKSEKIIRQLKTTWGLPMVVQPELGAEVVAEEDMVAGVTDSGMVENQAAVNWN